MIYLILLAAGNSRRFGENKLLWKLDGKPLMLHTLEKLMAIEKRRGWRVLVVTQDAAVEKLAAHTGALTVTNPLSAQGISTSIRAALDAISPCAQHAAFFVADQPYTRSETIENFIDGYLKSSNAVGCVGFLGELGNPAVFSAKYFPELRALKGDRGGKAVILKHMDDCFIYEASEARELMDMDVRP